MPFFGQSCLASRHFCADDSQLYCPLNEPPSACTGPNGKQLPSVREQQNWSTYICSLHLHLWKKRHIFIHWPFFSSLTFYVSHTEYLVFFFFLVFVSYILLAYPYASYLATALLDFTCKLLSSSKLCFNLLQHQHWFDFTTALRPKSWPKGAHDAFECQSRSNTVTQLNKNGPVN